MAAIYSNGGNSWNILGFNFTKRDALSSLYKISMIKARTCIQGTKFIKRQYRWQCTDRRGCSYDSLRRTGISG